MEEEIHATKDFVTVNSCKGILKKLDKAENRANQNILKYSIWKGKAIEQIRRLRKIKTSNLSSYIRDNVGLIMSKSLIALCLCIFKLSKRHPKLYNCTLSQHFVRKYFNDLEDFLDDEVLAEAKDNPIFPSSEESEDMMIMVDE